VLGGDQISPSGLQGLVASHQQKEQIQVQLETMLRNEKNAELQSRATDVKDLLAKARRI
jgi:hypothetical protein